MTLYTEKELFKISKPVLHSSLQSFISFVQITDILFNSTNIDYYLLDIELHSLLMINKEYRPLFGCPCLAFIGRHNLMPLCKVIFWTTETVTA